MPSQSPGSHYSVLIAITVLFHKSYMNGIFSMYPFETGSSTQNNILEVHAGQRVRQWSILLFAEPYSSVRLGHRLSSCSSVKDIQVFFSLGLLLEH